jgi:hypothetical protein
MLQSSIHVFPRVARRCTDGHFSCLLSAGPMVYATDTAVALRSSAFTLPDVIPDSPAIDTLVRMFDKYSSAADLRLAALGPKAKCPGAYPIISENLRAYCRYSKNHGEKAAFYPVGDCMVNASLLADVLAAIPDACVYAVPGDPFKPLFFRGKYAEGLLFPVRLPMRGILHSLQLLADYQRESGEQGADPSHPFMTIPLDKIYEQAEAEDKRQQEERRQQEQEREARMRQSHAEEAAQREQAEKEKAEKRESTRKILLSDGENMPVDGAALCELAAEMGVSIPLRTKGFILQKLATISISDGQFKHYKFRAKKKGTQGSDACFKYIQALIDALKMQLIEEKSENSPENNVPELENRPANLEKPAAKESNSCIYNIDMGKFCEQFQKEYNFLYDCRGYVAGYDEAVSAFDRFQIDHADFVREFAQYRGNVVSSDREAAAFMFALNVLDDPGPNPDGTSSHSERPAENNGAHSEIQPPIPPQNGAKSDDRPTDPSRNRKKPNPEKRHEATRKANADKALLQIFVESDLSRFGHVTADTQSALQFQGYFWDGSKLRKCKKPLHVFSVSTG